MGEAGLAYGIASLMWARCSKTIEYYQCAGMVLDQAGNYPVFSDTYYVVAIHRERP
jgi:hypothetical protein